MARRHVDRVVDHALTWIVAAPLAAMSIALLVGPFLDTRTVRDGMDGVALFWAIAFGYGAAAVVQQHYWLVPRWRPGWSEALGAIWFGGWTVLVAGSVVRDSFVGGMAVVAYWLFPGALLWGLFVAVPIIAARIVRSRPRYRSWTYD